MFTFDLKQLEADALHTQLLIDDAIATGQDRDYINRLEDDYQDQMFFIWETFEMCNLHVRHYQANRLGYGLREILSYWDDSLPEADI